MTLEDRTPKHRTLEHRTLEYYNIEDRILEHLEQQNNGTVEHRIKNIEH